MALRFCDTCGVLDEGPRAITYRGVSRDGAPTAEVIAKAAKQLSETPTEEELRAFAELQDPSWATTCVSPETCENRTK